MSGREKDPVLAKLDRGHPFFDVVTDAYRAFDYPVPRSLDVCEGCCMEPTIEADFFTPPIAELPLAYLQDWYSAAYDPKGVSKETWGYLLPRILEVLAAGEDVANVGLEVSLSRFATGDASNWSDAEWRVLDLFQRMYLDRAVKDDTECLDDVVCMFALGGWSLPDLFAQITAMPTEALVRRFWNDWCRNSAPGRETVWITAFWDGTGRSAAFEFYTSPIMHSRFERFAFREDAGTELSEKALAVLSVIERSRA